MFLAILSLYRKKMERKKMREQVPINGVYNSIFSKKKEEKKETRT